MLADSVGPQLLHEAQLPLLQALDKKSLFINSFLSMDLLPADQADEHR